MDGAVLCLSMLASFLCLGWTKNQTCLTSASTCEECIKSGPECGWCMDPKLPPLCGTTESLQSVCSQVFDPRGNLKILRNQPADGRSILLAPQELSITLRPGVSQVFHFTMTAPRDPLIVVPELKANELPQGLTITMRKVSTTNPAVFVVILKADKCPSNEDPNAQNKTGPWSFDILPSGFSQVTKVEISLECNCECLNKSEAHSPECYTHGTRVCGLCLCQEPYSGHSCQTDTNYCRPNPLAPICSGRGICEDNICVCKKSQNANEKYYGHFCECSNFECPLYNGSVCGDHGKCECGQCICDEGWTGEVCSCTMDSAPCMGDNQMICNGRGICECGVCKCEPPFRGPTCESCPTCENLCQSHLNCVECRVFETDRCDSGCRDLTVNLVDTKQDVPTTPLCKMITQKDSCIIYFSYSGPPSNGQLTVAKTKECPRPMYQ